MTSQKIKNTIVFCVVFFKCQEHLAFQRCKLRSVTVVLSVTQNQENFEVTMMATADGELGEDTVTQIEVDLKVLRGFRV